MMANPRITGVEDPMDMMLTYVGPLPSRNAHSANAVKNHIRRVISPQIAEFCRTHPNFSFLTSPGGQDPIIGGVQFVCLVDKALVAGLRIEFLRRDEPGSIFTGGDLDGRLKTLLDGLRMPHSADEMHGFSPGTAPFQYPPERCYCLLEDDSLITAVEITTHRLLRPRLPDEAPTNVDLRIQVHVSVPNAL